MAKTSKPPGWPRSRWGRPGVAVATATAARLCGLFSGCFTLLLWLMYLARSRRPYLSVDWSDPLKDVNAETWRASLFTFNPRFFGSLWGGCCMGVVSVGMQMKYLRVRLITRSWLRFALWNLVQALFANLGFCGGLGFAGAAVSFLAVLLALVVHFMHPHLPVSWEIDCMPSPTQKQSLPSTRVSDAFLRQSHIPWRRGERGGRGSRKEVRGKSGGILRKGRTGGAAAASSRENLDRRKSSCSRGQPQEQTPQQQQSHHDIPSETAEQQQEGGLDAGEELHPQQRQRGEERADEKEATAATQHVEDAAEDAASKAGDDAEAAEMHSRSDSQRPYEEDNAAGDGSSDPTAACHHDAVSPDCSHVSTSVPPASHTATADNQAAGVAGAREDTAAAETEDGSGGGLPTQKASADVEKSEALDDDAVAVVSEGSAAAVDAGAACIGPVLPPC